jgi:glycosyltransferase involved in cell wall biosynthesis
VTVVSDFRYDAASASLQEVNERPIEPLISVALCTYNGARYLREQLDSLLAQTHRNIEIVAVDDCSTDGTLSVLQEYQRRDARVRAIANQTNLGFRNNFERAISLCAGDFVAPCDQDDVWLPQKLATLLGVIGDHPLAYCDSELIDEQGASLNIAMSDIFAMVSTDDPAVFAAGNCVSGHAMLFRRELFERACPVPGCFFHDWWLAAVAASMGGVVYCGSKLVKYRYHGSNVTDILGERTLRRFRGYRWKQMREFRERLEHLAALPGGSRAFIERLRDLWIKREDQWFSLTLAWFIFRNGSRLFALRKAGRHPTKYVLRYAPGLRLKRIANPHGYARSD